MVEIPNHLKSAIAETLRVEGGFNPHDKHGFPTYRGITSAKWQEWLRDNKSLHLSEDQAGQDLSHIAGRGGKSYSGFNKVAYENLAPKIFHKDYFTDYGFDKIHSEKIQKFVMEISFHRGPDSARWAMMYAAGIEARDSDPLLKEKLTKSEKRRHAVDYANAFLALGHAPNQHTLDEDKNKPMDAQAEQRFYGRLRVAKLVEESHFVAYGKDGALSRARGLFNRAFDYQWPTGLSKENPGLDAEKDKYFLSTYHNFLDIHQAYNKNHNKAAFDTRIKATSVDLANDPCSPLNQKKHPEKKADCSAPTSSDAPPPHATASEPGLWAKTKAGLSWLDPRPIMHKIGEALYPTSLISFFHPPTPSYVVRFELPPAKDYSVKPKKHFVLEDDLAKFDAGAHSHAAKPHVAPIHTVSSDKPVHTKHHSPHADPAHPPVKKSVVAPEKAPHDSHVALKDTPKQPSASTSSHAHDKSSASHNVHSHSTHPALVAAAHAAVLKHPKPASHTGDHEHDAHVTPPKLPSKPKAKPAVTEHHHR